MSAAKDDISPLQQANAPVADVAPTRQTPQPKNATAEKAVEFLASHGSEDISFTWEEEKAVLARIDRRVLVLLLGAYFFQQLDKSTLSYVSIFGIIEDANLKDDEYSWLGSILYFAQLGLQPLAAFILVKFPNGKVVSAAILMWGSMLCIMAACTDFASLLALRFLLGAFEAMIAPCCVAITQMWWRRGEQTLRTSYWNAMNGVTFVVGSLFTYGLGHIEPTNGMYKYQIIFLFCGLLTVIYGVAVGLLMPDSPMEAKYLKEREKLIAVERLRANQMGISSRQWRWDHVLDAALDLKTWLWFVIMLAISIASGSISTFGNLIVTSFGYSNFETILFNIPFGVIQIIAIIGSAWLAGRWGKGIVISVVSIAPTVGTVLMLTVPREQKGVLLFGYYLVSFLAAVTPLLYAWQAQNTSGDTKKKCTSAVVFISMCTGNVIGPQLFSPDDAPLYRKGLIADLAMFVLVGILGALIPIYLKLLNRRHQNRREELGKAGVLVDESMLRKRDMQDGKAVELEDATQAQGRMQRIVEEDKGLQDVTDLKNEDFIYTY